MTSIISKFFQLQYQQIVQHVMGRTKKLNCETNEKILGKLPKVKSNIGNLDFDEDDIDGISILSFKTFTDLMVSLQLHT